MDAIRDIVKFPVIPEPRLGESTSRCQVVQPCARHHEWHSGVGQRSPGNETYGGRPDPPPDVTLFADHDVDVDHALRDVSETGLIEFAAHGVLPQNEPDCAAIHLDNGAPIPLGRGVLQELDIRFGFAPGATDMIRMQPPFNERQVIARGIAKLHIHDNPLLLIHSFVSLGRSLLNLY